MKEIQHATKRTTHITEIPNLVELQLNSYRWFLEEGLQELFESFSPIFDFTGNTSISLTDFTLGEPKYSVEECRDRDMTFESPITAKMLRIPRAYAASKSPWTRSRLRPRVGKWSTVSIPASC